MDTRRIQTILDHMHELFGDYPTTELNYETDFQCLIAVMMSAQTTDKQVNKVTETLFQKIREPQDVLDMGLEILKKNIKTIGLWKGKAKNIYTTAQMLVDKPLPDTIEGMIVLPGVGIKTAKVVLHVVYGQRWVAVDTHVHRVMNRLGVVNTKTPEHTSELLETIIPEKYKDIAHHTIIYFGRYLCIARKPKCHECPLTRICPSYKLFKNK